MLDRRDILVGIGTVGTGAIAANLTDGAESRDLEWSSKDEATHTAVASGAWDDPAVWSDSAVPADGARVLIEDGVAVTLAGETARLEWLRIEGALTFAPTVDTHLKADTVVSLSGSQLQIGTANDPIQPSVEARVTFLDTGPIGEEQDPDRVDRGLVVGGDLSVHGAEKTSWTELARAPTAGDSHLDLPEAPTNWKAEDEIVIPGMVPNDDQDEERRIESVDSSTVQLSQALDHDHLPPKPEFDAYVLNLSRSVTFESENTDEHRRGHVMIMSTETDIRYARFSDLGRTNKAEYLTNPIRGNDHLPEQDDPNPAARYPLHWHRTGIGADPHYVEGVVADGSPGWGIVNHHAHVTVVDSITYDVLGAGFVAEGGNERGSFDNCMAVHSEGSGEPIDSRSAGAHGGDPPIDDFGHAGHGFWLQSPLVEVTNCVAAGHRHQAFVWWLRPLLDGDLAEGTSIDDSRVTFHPNLPWEYCNTDRPLFEAIERGRFENEQVMLDTQKIPSTFAEIRQISGNTAFASAGGADFSRHNFKWKHERFSDFNVVDDMTVHSIGPFIDSDGTVHEPDLPRHRAAGHQGRGGSVGVSFRYTSNVTLSNSLLVGIGRDDSVGVPFHDYRWTNTIDNCTIENWDWGVGAGEHRLTWVRNSSFAANVYDVKWVFDNVGPAILDGNDLSLASQSFSPNNQKAADVLTFGRDRGMRIDGRSAYVEESAPEYVPFPDQDALDGLNNIEDIATVDDETDLVGLTNAEMYDRYDICIGGTPHPSDAVTESDVHGSVLDPVDESTPAESVYLESTNASALGAWEVVSDPDAAGDQCLRWTGSSSPSDNSASIDFDSRSGTYRIHARIWPKAWIGDDVHFRIDGGSWRTAEKLKTPIGFQWHDVSLNDGTTHEWALSDGSHTLEFYTTNDDVKIDEIAVVEAANAEVLGGYGLPGAGDVAAAPAVDSLSLTEVETNNSDAEFDVSWSVSDADGDLSSVDLTLTDETDGETEDSASLRVSGDSASGTTRVVAAGDEGSGNSYTVEGVVTDSSGNTASGMASTTESESVPNVDDLAASEVETDNSDAEFDVSWSASDVDGDLSSIHLTLTDDTDGETEASASSGVSGDTARGTTRLVATGDDGSGNSYTVEGVVTDSFDNTDSATVSIEEGESTAQEPYTAHDLAQIEAEDFDTGGEGVAYHDTSDGNKGGAYRDTDIDIEAADDDTGEYNVAWIRDGEWLEYTVEVPEDGEYDLRARLAGKNSTTLDVLVDGSTVATVDVPDTGGWQEWTTVEAGTVSLTAGTHVFRLEANGRDFNINWFGFEQQDGGRTDGQSAYTDHDLAQIEAEDFDTGGEGVAYHDTSDGNKGGAYRDTDVDIEAADDDTGAYNLSWIREGEWLEYTVEVPEDGEYDLRARLAGKNSTTLDVLVDGSTVTSVLVPDTGGWQEWTTVEAGTVSLTAGTHVFRLKANGGEFNINWFGFNK